MVWALHLLLLLILLASGIACFILSALFFALVSFLMRSFHQLPLSPCHELPEVRNSQEGIRVPNPDPIYLFTHRPLGLLYTHFLDLVDLYYTGWCGFVFGVFA